MIDLSSTSSIASGVVDRDRGHFLVSAEDEEVRPMAEPAEPAQAADVAPAARSDRSPWNWLLLIPIVIPLLTPLYNQVAPRLWGFPKFYWLQLLFIVVGVATTTLVYQMTKRPTPATPPAPPASRAAVNSDE
jgi:Protein of unknown function (DUF3311)